MLDAFDHGAGSRDANFANHLNFKILDSDSIFTIPAIQSTRPDNPAKDHPETVVLMEGAPTSPRASMGARARQGHGSRWRTNSFEHSRHEASRRGTVDFAISYRSSPPRRRQRYRSRSRERPLYPDYYTPRHSPRDRLCDRSNDPRVKELFEGICAEERNIAALVSSMTDMDVGRDDRHRGNGYRGGNKRRRDGKQLVHSLDQAANAKLQMRMIIITVLEAATIAVDPSADASTTESHVADMRSPPTRSCAEQS